MKDARAGRRRSGRTQPARPAPAATAGTEPTPEPALRSATAPVPAPAAPQETEPTSDQPSGTSGPASAPPSVPSSGTVATPARRGTSTPSRSPQGRPGGRPRDPDREAEIVAAGLALVAEEGLPGLTMDALAARAGASKATLYRRWPDRLRLAVQLLERTVAERPAPPDAGTVSADLAALLRTIDAELHGAAGALVLGLAAEARRTPSLADDLRRHHAGERDRIRTVLTRGVERGVLDADTDLDLLAEMVVATGLERAITSAAPLTRRAAEELAGRLLAAASAGQAHAGR